jgi:plasmid maintenance system killer protein
MAERTVAHLDFLVDVGVRFPLREIDAAESQYKLNRTMGHSRLSSLAADERGRFSIRM